MKPSNQFERTPGVSPEARTEAIHTFIRSELDGITAQLKENYNIEGISFGSSVRRRHNSNEVLRGAHDIDYRIVAPDAVTAEHAAIEYKAILEKKGVRNLNYGIAEAYGNCPRLSYDAHVEGIVVPVEIFFENKSAETGMFGGLDNADIRHRRIDDLDQVSRAQDIRTLLVSLLHETEVAGVSEKRAQRMNDLTELYSKYTALALERARRRGVLQDWLAAGNPALKELIERNQTTLDQILHELHEKTIAREEDQYTIKKAA